MAANSNELTLEDIQNFKGKYPRQLWSLFMSEMWERFSFYGMRGMLTIFMVDRLLLSEKDANLQYGATQAFVYTFAFVGGLFADKILGFRKSIFWGGFLMILGSFILALNPEKFFYIGISFTIIGTGFFKPNISTMVGNLYKPDDPRRDAGFGLFYSGINVGALLGGALCVYLGKHYSWNTAFSLAGIVMTLSLIIFIFTKKTLGPIGLSPLLGKVSVKKIRIYDILVYGGSLLVIPLIRLLVSNSNYTDLFMYTVGPLTLIYIVYETFKYGKIERQKLLAAMIFIIFSIFFWAFFEQAGGSLSLFAKYNLNDKVIGIPMDPNVINNSSNSLFVIIISPLIGLLWLWLNKRKIEPNTVVKFGLGFLFLSAAFYVFYYTRFFAVKGITSLNVFTLAYFVITLGELCLSPIGLSIMTKLSPKPLHGVMMGMWFLASAYGQYAAGLLGAGMATPEEKATLIEKLMSYSHIYDILNKKILTEKVLTEKLISYTDGYKQLSIYALIAGIILIAISPLIRKIMHEVQ